MKHTELDGGGGKKRGGGVRGRSEGEGELCEGIRAPKGGMLTVLSFLLIHFLIYFKDMLPFFQNLVFKDQLSYWIRSSSETY